MKRWEWGLLCGLTLLAFIVHAAYRIRGFGEQDEARIAIFAMDWLSHGVFAGDTYLNRTSPLYLLGLRFALSHGLSYAGLADALNLVNVAFGALSVPPMFLLFRRLAGDASVAFLGVAVYSVVPAYFYGQGYGMPHIPSLACFLTSLACFGRYLEGGASQHLALGAALVASALASAFKADIVMCGLAFPALVLCLGTPTPRRFFTACALPAFGVAAGLALYHAAMPVETSAARFAADWSGQFPFDLRALVDKGHARITLYALGSVLWGTTAVAVYACVARRGRGDALVTRTRRLALLTAAWALPTVLFWGMIWAHAARHLTAALVPVALLVAVGVSSLLGTLPRTAAAVFAVLVANYFSADPTNHPHRAGPRLFGSLEQMQKLADHFTTSGRDFAEARADRKLLLGGGAIPYCEYELLSRTRHFARRVTTTGVLWDVELEPTPPGLTRFVRVRFGQQAAPEREDPRYFVWVAETGKER
ncbi:MAG TPA: hypothetical protein VNN72_05975 [Polyangiaceae bacterium]|nr:hypothetical protein [Polyangiaceae bacterium]